MPPLTPELVISVIALLFSFYALLQMRKHNRLSLIPNFDWHTDRKRVAEGITFKFTLKNTGIGPAIILSRFFLLDGKRFVTDLADPVPPLADICFRGKIQYALNRHGSPGIGSIFPSGHEICIAEVFIPGMKAHQEQEFEKLVDRLNYEVRYQSLHGETFVFTTVESRQIQQKS